MDEACRLVDALKDKLTATDNDDKHSLKGDTVHPLSVCSDRSSKAVRSDTVEHARIREPCSVPSRPYRPRYESAVVTSPKRIVTSPKRPQRSAVLTTWHLPTSPPPPLPKRPSSSVSSRSSSQSVAKRYRPPPPLPDEAVNSTVRPQKACSPHPTTPTRKSLSPAVRRSAPVARCSTMLFIFQY